MKQLNIIPNPNKIDYLGGSVKMENIDSESFSARLTDKLPEEGYVLEVTENGVEATAGGERGAFYASQTLKQLKQLDICPCVRIEDAPAFEYRAFMLDCARHMTTVENIKKLIDAAALVKMNTMHWHLTDGQGWRVEIDSHPELITVGSRRRSSDFGQYHFAEEYSGYFTKDEIREVVAYADDNYIEVIPEFDMPGHTLSVLAAYPELSCKGKPLEVGTKQGIFDDILCAGNDDSLKLVFDVLSEMIELFPGRYFHIGGDEAPKDEWKTCESCQRKMKELGLTDEEDLQAHFTAEIANFLKTLGKTAICWNDALKSSLIPADVVCQYWDEEGEDPAYCTKDAAFAKRKWIYSFTGAFYFDYPAEMTPLRQTYQFRPKLRAGVQIPEENLLGIECALWSEQFSTRQELLDRAFPRMFAVAERGWATEGDLAEFKDRCDRLIDSLATEGIPIPSTEEMDPSGEQQKKTLIEKWKPMARQAKDAGMEHIVPFLVKWISAKMESQLSPEDLAELQRELEEA